MDLKLTQKLVIIGSGPAALTAAIYASRANLEPLIVRGNEPGGQLMGTSHVENWPGEISILGPALINKIETHAKHLGTEFLNREIVKVDFNNKPFSLITNKNETIKANAVIIATGANPKKLNCKGEETYWGKGVTTCAVCDGAFYKDQPVVIVGGGDSAVENATFMTKFTDKVTLVHILDKLTASHAMQSKILNDKRINIIYNSTVDEILGNNNHVQEVMIKNQKTGQKDIIKTSAVFIAIGLTPNTEIFKDQIELNNYGYIVLKEHTKTSVDGIFAAGDVADSRYRQAITSAGSGCAASLDAEHYLGSL
ncbi:thioredoxin-disulfide reductase [Candidatus Babela massiliensis]|uniref:Thioredoxin reductase n=1 Tax=Candidatus Babela massiliensis TaxID=673862 RepID=V6DID2_9BACT|nr:thioredoxin-disulfide reductase [Candidatus Babela massiliensis]CDK30286.1 Thioredoxin reductase [Candidatus Babela massiliensis]